MFIPWISKDRWAEQWGGTPEIIREQIYIKGRWTPFIKIRLRY